MRKNICLLTDSYKQSHQRQYPPGTQRVYSYLESRGGAYNPLVFYGLQYYLKEYLVGKVVTREKIDYAQGRVNAHFGTDVFNIDGWNLMLSRYGGTLPVTIKALPEGCVVHTGIPLFVIENLDPDFWWLTNFLETILCQVWYPITIASNSYFLRRLMAEYVKLSGHPDTLNYKVHDFGFRGCTTPEQAAVGASAHLLSFDGTDTFVGCELATEYYNEPSMVGHSIAASEHSTITSWGKLREAEAYENMLNLYPDQMFACVSDSYDIYNATGNIWGGVLRDKVKARSIPMVIRPDCYDDQTEILTLSGWKLFSHLRPEEKVGQYHADGTVTFVIPSRIISKEYKGKMVCFVSDKSGVDLIVTPNHRMIRLLTNGNGLLIKEAQDTKFNYNYRHIVAGRKIGERTSLTPFERLSIAFQADGSYPSKRTDGRKCIRFNFSKKRKVKRLLEICGSGNFEHKVSIEPGRPYNTQVYVWVDDWPSKTFDWVEIEDKDWKWCQEFIQECKHWDGSIRSETRSKYDSTVKSNAEVVQLVAALAGFKTYYSVTEDKRKEQFSDVFTVHILEDRCYAGGQSIKKQVLEYDGSIYCVTVPSGMVMVRRNKRISISGNSGDPMEVIPRLLNIASQKFGRDFNEQGYKVLRHVRFIQGDGVDTEAIEAISKRVISMGYSIDNLAFGSGGGLLQKFDRDTNKFAIKCSQATINGESINVFKDPVTDHGKSSKRGRFKVVNVNGVLNWANEGECLDKEDCLQTVFHNGELIKEHNYLDIRNRVRQHA